MKEVITYKELEKESKQMLKDAHRMLKALEIPVCPLNRIAIQISKNNRKYHIATCEEMEDESFLIDLHPIFLKEPVQNGKREQLFCSIMHELLHTCKNQNHEYGLWEHNEEYCKYASDVLQAYHINVMTNVKKSDIPYSNLNPTGILRCPNCLTEIVCYTEKSWNTYKQQLQEGTTYNCDCCHSNLIGVFG